MSDLQGGHDFELNKRPESASLLAAFHPDDDRPDEPGSWAAVPWRTIVGSVAVVLGTYLTIVVVLATARVLTWVLIAGFFAIVLAPLVKTVQQRVRGRRALATSIVVFSTLLTMIGAAVLFVMPVRTQLAAILSDLPGTVHRAATGKGPVGRIVKQLHIESYVQDNEAELTQAADSLTSSSFNTAKILLGAAFAFITITLITFLFLTQSAAMARAVRSVIPRRQHATVNRVAADAAAAVSGYMIGNLLISVIAGVSAFVCLVALGVPSPVVLALWVAFADLLPLVGATLGASVCVLAAYLQSPTAGLISLIFFVVYQQVENGVIYPWLMARKVKVNPLSVLLSVLLAVELFGIVGALLAVPISGAFQVVLKAMRQSHPRERLVLPDSMLDEPGA
ncbi:MAG: AI-2E family transporter [Actinomycetota bacterium]|nr:AI-2E family transporter [Actinomycetota bacterium]